MIIIVTHFEVIRNDVRSRVVGRGVVDADHVAFLVGLLIGDLMVEASFPTEAAGSAATRFPEDGADLPTELFDEAKKWGRLNMMLEFPRKKEFLFTLQRLLCRCCLQMYQISGGIILFLTVKYLQR